jgi:hypothetical protein
MLKYPTANEVITRANLNRRYLLSLSTQWLIFKVIIALATAFGEQSRQKTLDKWVFIKELAVMFGKLNQGGLFRGD